MLLNIEVLNDKLWLMYLFFVYYNYYMKWNSWCVNNVRQSTQKYAEYNKIDRRIFNWKCYVPIASICIEQYVLNIMYRMNKVKCFSHKELSKNKSYKGIGYKYRIRQRLINNRSVITASAESDLRPVWMDFDPSKVVMGTYIYKPKHACYFLLWGDYWPIFRLKSAFDSR